MVLKLLVIIKQSLPTAFRHIREDGTCGLSEIKQKLSEMCTGIKVSSAREFSVTRKQNSASLRWGLNMQM